MSSRKIERELKREFPDCKFELTRKSHIRMILPNGRFVITSGSPSDVRAIRNIRTTIRREETRK